MYSFFKLSFLQVSMLLVLAYPVRATAQSDPDYSVHANIIYHFTKYIDWPDNKKTGEFIIGIIGESPLYEELKKSIAGKKVGKQKIVIRILPVSSVSFSCHILFVSDIKSNNMKKIAAATAGTAILIVSEAEGLAQKGGCINFTVVHERLRLEINKNNIEQRGMNIASELLQLGKVVK